MLSTASLNVINMSGVCMELYISAVGEISLQLYTFQFHYQNT